MSARVEIYREVIAGQMNASQLFGHDTAAEIARNQGGTRAGKWRWRYVSSNGRILADSGQGYVRRIDCLHACQTVLGTGDPELNTAGALHLYRNETGFDEERIALRDLTRAKP